jgi:hypothetical protein
MEWYCGCSSSLSTESTAHVLRSENIIHWAGVEGWHQRGSLFVQHMKTFPLYAAVCCQADWFKGAEERQ